MVQEIQTLTGARVFIDDAAEGKEVARVVARTRESLDAALTKINEVVKTAREAPPRPAPAFSCAITVRGRAEGA